MLPRFLASDALEIFLFNGHGLTHKSRVAGFLRRVKNLRPGEILRLFVDQNPLDLIRLLVIRYGSKFIFQYLQNKEGAVIIDFKRVQD